MKVAIAIGAGLFAIAVGVHMLGQIGTAPPPAAQPTSVNTSPEYTKAEFSNHVFGKTKSQIRAEFGRPDMVDDGSDSWYYNSLKVFDPDAGTHAIAVIRFEGIQGSEDSVAQVRYN